MGRSLFGRREARVGLSHEEVARRAVAEVTASRRSIAQAYETERRRIERDLHDGTQQYLVAALMHLGEAQLSETLADDDGLNRCVVQAKTAVKEALDSLRAIVHAIHPHLLGELGLEEAVRELAATGPAPVTVRCPHALPPIPAAVAAAAYFFVAEAVTNVAKHAAGASATILLAADADLHLSVVDDGGGGADVVAGGGLAGMQERLAAFGGSLRVCSPAGGPTQVSARVPLLLDAGQSAVDLSRCEAETAGHG